MPFEPVFETINISQRKGKLTDQIKVECRTDIPTEAVNKIINISAFPQIIRSETVAGQVKYGGKIAFFICYENVEGEIKKCECGAEFTGAVSNDAVTENTRALTSAEAQKPEASLSGVKLSVSAYVDVCAVLYECVKYNALSGGENIISKNTDVTYVRSFGIKESAYSVEDEFEVGYKVGEVISHRAQAVITSVQCGVGVIIVDGEVYLSAIFLQSGDKKDIIRENRTIPYRMEIECEDAMPAFGATARVSTKSFKTDINVDEEKGVSVINAEAMLVFSGEAFSEETASVAEDAFSLSEELKLQKQRVESYKDCDVRSCSARVNGRAATDELPVGANLFAACGEKAEIAECVKNDDSIKITGTLYLTALFCDGEGKIFSRSAETPFETTVECVLPQSAEIEVTIVSEHAQCRIISLSEIETEAELFFTVYPCEKNHITCISGIEASGEKVENDCAISVYIPVKGEELWTLSKRLNISPDNLVATNKELQFPLSGEERIVVYRGK